MGRDASRATSAVARLLHEELQALSDG
jgi:hypothetical protein